MSLVPPVTCDGWFYSGELYVEASGHNRHRRATIPELNALFGGNGGSKDPPGHWYEAQLIHYGLPPSKTKGTAKMRLFEAVNKGNLAVPAHILSIEAELKKEWTKREREAKQALKKAAAPAAATPARGSSKRKADEGTNVNINLSVSIGPRGNVQITTPEPAAKKTKTSSTSKKSAPTKPAPTKLTPETSTQTARVKKQTARRGPPSSRVARSVSSRPAPSSPSDEPATRPTAPRTKQTARRSRPFIIGAGPGRSTTTAASSHQLPRFDITPSQWDLPDNNDPPPPYPGSPRVHGSGIYDNGYTNDNAQAGSQPLPALGLLNGRYRLRCTGPREYVDRDEDSSIIFTLDGEALWGLFEIGPLKGILRLDERPWAASPRPMYFSWRGEDSQGGEHDEADDGSYVKFLGDGVVVGRIGFYGGMLEFSGYRVSGQATRSEIGVFEMRREWEERRL
ncbi:hypothetical protein N657DRAFT_564689 [Parathielavia appendiculata]|uniref:Uncharacterized protein n=1 Tax=Parathielavia appendiculata TaxID=2587402 RepID=A0AAN6U597_9PEZI|nr:hypothetical protein N657DRAFT_564689 [Parathielavia appendiculata]